MTNSPGTIPEFPLTEQTFYILLSLSHGPRHGYAILKDVEQFSERRTKISVSTLYTVLKRLLESGWIERVPREEPEENIRPRKEYQLTQVGRYILLAETKRLHSLVKIARQQLSQELE